MALFYKIGGLVIKTNDCFDDEAKYHLAFYEAAPTDKPDISFLLHTDCNQILFPVGKLIAEVNRRYWYETADGYSFADQADEIAPDVLNRMDATRDFSKVEAWFCPKDVFLADMEDKRPYHMIHEVLRYALLLRDGLIMHASSLAWENKGILFSAPSGTGKSTHTQLWKKFVPGTEIVNDDMPILRMVDGIPYLCGAPWSGKSSIHKNMEVPLRAVVFLERAETCLLEPMDPMEAVFRLWEAINKPAMPDLAEKNLELMGRIIENVPVYLLHCNISKEAVETSMAALL